MTATRRLVAIELRRSVALWLVPLLVALSWPLVGDRLRLQVVLWVVSSVGIAQSLVFTGPFVAGAAAWAAGRERRRGLEELLAATPRPALARDLALWGGTVAWGMVAYGLVAAYVALLTARKATWDGPYPWPILVGLLGILANASVGYAVGRWLPHRFTPPLVAVGLFVAQVYVGWIMASGQGSPLAPAAYLSPIAVVFTSVWHGVRPQVAPAQALWLLGLTAVGLAAVALRERRSTATGAALAAALLLAGGGGAWTVRGAGEQPAALASDELSRSAAAIPHEPVCGAGPFVVCVHPAFAAWLDEVSADVNRAVAPLSGLPGMPVRAEHAPLTGDDERPGAVVRFNMQAVPGGPYAAAGIIVRCVVARCGGFDDGAEAPARSVSEAQDVIYGWLWNRAGLDPAYAVVGSASGGRFDESTPVLAARERFAALEPSARRAWLEANLAALRAGELTLEELP
jgi:hypothetical protein